MIQLLKDKHGYKNLVHIGDGATDLEACPPAVSPDGSEISLTTCTKLSLSSGLNSA